jgi:hypothetical protein
MGDADLDIVLRRVRRVLCVACSVSADVEFRGFQTKDVLARAETLCKLSESSEFAAPSVDFVQQHVSELENVKTAVEAVMKHESLYWLVLNGAFDRVCEDSVWNSECA